MCLHVKNTNANEVTLDLSCKILCAFKLICLMFTFSDFIATRWFFTWQSLVASVNITARGFLSHRAFIFCKNHVTCTSMLARLGLNVYLLFHIFTPTIKKKILPNSETLISCGKCVFLYLLCKRAPKRQVYLL